MRHPSSNRLSETLRDRSHIVIMAGGTGTRLWPLSRKSRPKQFQSFVSKKTLLQETYDRVNTLVRKENIHISTISDYAPMVLEQLPDVAPEQLILEPEARNTAPAIALAALSIRLRDPKAYVATIASDHAIENPAEFRAALIAAFETAGKHPEMLVTIGINPTHPDTNYGYIRMGQKIGTISGKQVFRIESFKEKPDRKTAEEYLTHWEYLWNAGYFVFSVDTFVQWEKTYAPDLHRAMSMIEKSLRKGTANGRAMKTAYRKAPLEAVEPLIVEKLPVAERAVVPSSRVWSDVGGWHSLYSFLSHRTGENNLVQGRHLDWKSEGLYLVHGTEKLVVTVGLKETVIVETEDAILIADRETLADEMKSLMGELKKKGPHYL
jgi:mannose-1-phosphate guanylyltransferase